jgi:hypothetical protein
MTARVALRITSDDNRRHLARSRPFQPALKSGDVGHLLFVHALEDIAGAQTLSGRRQIRHCVGRGCSVPDGADSASRIRLSQRQITHVAVSIIQVGIPRIVQCDALDSRSTVVEPDKHFLRARRIE